MQRAVCVGVECEPLNSPLTLFMIMSSRGLTDRAVVAFLHFYYVQVIIEGEGVKGRRLGSIYSDLEKHGLMCGFHGAE